MLKRLFSKNKTVKLSAVIIACTLAVVPALCHIDALSTVHADNSIAGNSVDTDDDSDITSKADESTDDASNDKADETDDADSTENKSSNDSSSSDKNTSTTKKSVSGTSKKSVSSKKKTASKNKDNKNKEPKNYKPIIGKTVAVTMEYYQNKLNKISSELKTTQNKASRTQRLITSKRRQLSSINTLKDKASEETGCVAVSDVFEPSQSLKTYAKHYDSSLSIYLNQQVSSQNKNKSSENAILPDFEKMSGLVGTVSIKQNIKHSKKAIKSSINKNTTKYKNMHKKIKMQKKAKDTVSKYVVVSVNSKNIFEPSNISTKTLKQALEGTNLEELAPAFVKAEKKYGINAIAMASIAALESGWGKSKRAVKDNNLTGLGVYSDSAKGINADTKEKNILMTAERLATNYSRPGQTFYHGTGFDGVNKKYSVSKTWGWKCENIAFRIMNKIANPGIGVLG